MKIQVISRDYNGTTVILDTVSDIEAALTRIKSEISDLNFQNALTTDDKFKTIEAYYPEFINSAGKIVDNMIYAGNATDGQHRVYVFGENDKPSLEIFNGQQDLQFYIGKNEGEEHRLSDGRGRMVDKLDHELLNGKTYYFIKVI